MNEDLAPAFSQAQIDYLNRIFPDRVPDVDASERDIWIAVGARKVIAKMILLEKNRSHKNILSH